MCSTRCYTFNRTFHIVIPQRKNGCANFIITLFHLIRCMIIPWREMRGQDTTGGQKEMTTLSSGSQAYCCVMSSGRHFQYGDCGNVSVFFGFIAWFCKGFVNNNANIENWTHFRPIIVGLEKTKSYFQRLLKMFLMEMLYNQTSLVTRGLPVQILGRVMGPLWTTGAVCVCDLQNISVSFLLLNPFVQPVIG